jgi:hypothetical protein
MSMREMSFYLPAGCKQDALEAIRGLRGKETIHDSSGWHFSWFPAGALAYPRSFEEMMALWRWSVETDEEGNISVIKPRYEDVKLGDERLLFYVIAPYVKDGSFIEMEGEDDRIWRWCFSSGLLGAKLIRAGEMDDRWGDRWWFEAGILSADPKREHEIACDLYGIHKEGTFCSGVMEENSSWEEI